MQHPDFGVGGAFEHLSGNRVRLDWWISSGDQASHVVQERIGLPDGFDLVDSSLPGGKRRNVPSFSEQWKAPIDVPAHSTITEWAVLSAPCSNVGSTVHARLRVWRDDGIVAGTGDGPPLDLGAC